MVEEMAHVGFYKVVYEKGVLAQREDIAAVGRKKIKAGKIYSGAFDKDGKLLYEGIPFCYSGYIHRAVLAQNVEQLDIDTWEINPKNKEMIEEFEKSQTLGNQESKAERRKAICEYLISQGYRLYWNP